ncbi:MAG: hypothetical protein U1F43_03700 [Myxococcota bacterium]
MSLDATLWVTGFGPFEDVPVNASGLVAERLHGRVVGGCAVVAEVLPTVFGVARARVAAAVRELAPRAVVALGVSRDDFVRIERRAAGAVASARADVAGEVWAGRSLGAAELVAAGGEALFYDRWVEAARAVDAQVQRSDDCGGYVCNAVYHAVLEATGARVPAVFVHLPRGHDEASLARRAAVVVALLDAMLASATAVEARA